MKRGTYRQYSVGCACVWGVILAAGERRLDPEARDRLRLTCAAWWVGWTSATIARAAYPPPKKLDPVAEKRLAYGSLALVALGFASVVRLLAFSRRTGR